VWASLAPVHDVLGSQPREAKSPRQAQQGKGARGLLVGQPGTLELLVRSWQVDQGRSCVHKLVLEALGTPGLEQRDLPTARELGRKAGLVEQVGPDSTGRFFAVRSSPKGVSPAHKMLHRSVEGAWYCQGKRDGCPSQHDWSHILAADLAV
jgi:hypothetical protein